MQCSSGDCQREAAPYRRSCEPCLATKRRYRRGLRRSPRLCALGCGRRAAAKRKLCAECLLAQSTCPHCGGHGYRVKDPVTGELVPREEIARLNWYWCRTCEGTGIYINQLHGGYAERAWGQVAA